MGWPVGGTGSRVDQGGVPRRVVLRPGFRPILAPLIFGHCPWAPGPPPGRGGRGGGGGAAPRVLERFKGGGTIQVTMGQANGGLGARIT